MNPGRNKHLYVFGDPLTPRELEILIYTGQGLSAKVLGRKLGISPATVMGHIYAIKIKLGASNKAHAMVLAMATNRVCIEDFGKARI
jgi:DNA-binding CsgD family transcriptional regulator